MLVDAGILPELNACLAGADDEEANCKTSVLRDSLSNMKTILTLQEAYLNIACRIALHCNDSMTAVCDAGLLPKIASRFNQGKDGPAWKRTLAVMRAFTSADMCSSDVSPSPWVTGHESKPRCRLNLASSAPAFDPDPDPDTRAGIATTEAEAEAEAEAGSSDSIIPATGGIPDPATGPVAFTSASASTSTSACAGAPAPGFGPLTRDEATSMFSQFDRQILRWLFLLDCGVELGRVLREHAIGSVHPIALRYMIGHAVKEQRTLCDAIMSTIPVAGLIGLVRGCPSMRADPELSKLAADQTDLKLGLAGFLQVALPANTSSKQRIIDGGGLDCLVLLL